MNFAVLSVRHASLSILAMGLLLTLCVIGCATTGTGAQRAVIRAKDKVAPALVHIRPVKEVFTRGRRREVLILGSGFIISSDGYVITNEHVAGKSQSVKCVLSNKDEVEAEVVGVDPYTDIAVLKLNVGHPLPYVALGDSDKLEAGQMVLALGSPHGLARSVSLGIVSVIDRHLESRGEMVSPFNNWIQTDAAINPGNSGGPLVNLRGKVVGVNARVLSGAENVGFAIPINIASEAKDRIIEYGRVRRSRLGITLQETLARTDDPSQLGVVIADVDPLSPASEAGLVPGDILLAINETPANARFKEDLPVVRKLIADLTVGDEAQLTIMRKDELLELSVVTQEQSELRGEELEFEEWGFTATELTPDIVRRTQLDSSKGIRVSGTQVGGIARNARIDSGDIILKVDGQEVENLAQFKRVYANIVASKKRLTVLWIKNRALTRFVMVKQEAEDQSLEDEGDHNDNE